VACPLDFLPLFGDLPPYRAPGERHHYSNARFIVLGLLVEEVAGRPFTEVVEERAFARAGMASSGFFRLDEARPDIAVGYLPRSSPLGLVNQCVQRARHGWPRRPVRPSCEANAPPSRGSDLWSFFPSRDPHAQRGPGTRSTELEARSIR
jgi:CubicO group peptidase (beta-lactamase class C family)